MQPPQPVELGTLINLDIPDELASAVTIAATSGLHLDPSQIPDAFDKILAVALAASRVLSGIQGALPTTIDPFEVNQAGTKSVQGTFGHDEWLQAYQTLIMQQQLGLWLAGQSTSLGAGAVDVTHYMSLTSSDALSALLSNLTMPGPIDVGCLDVSSATFSFSANLNQPSACFSTDSSLLFAFLSMNAAE